MWTEIGTPLYASPEMWSGERYSAKSDVWSFGCVIYELASLKQPFKGKNNFEISSKIKEGSYSRIPLRYTNKLSDFIAKCLTIDVEKRATVNTLLEIVNSVRGSVIKTKRTKGGEPSLQPPISVPENYSFLNEVLPCARF